MYHADSPISKGSEDRLQRRAFAADLARALVNLDYQDTFTVGLFGEWGSGKTSVINMMLEEIEAIGERDKGNIPLVVKFEPWLFSDASQLVGQFLVHLANELNEKEPEWKAAAREILKYKFMLDLLGFIPDGQPIVATTKGIASYIEEKLKGDLKTMDVAAQKRSIINLLAGLKRKVVVIIDDIDRLSNEQIRHVFQLITSVAKFPKVAYFLSFDRQIVVKALEEVQKGDGHDYLEKVIQVPILLPGAGEEDVEKILINELNKIPHNASRIGDHDKRPLIDLSVDYDKNIFGCCIVPFIQNVRDIHRLYNVVLFKSSILIDEVCFVDLVAISVLELLYPNVHRWIGENKSAFTGTSGWGAFDRKRLGVNRNGQEETAKMAIEPLLEKSISNDKSIKSIEEIAKALSALFPSFCDTAGHTDKFWDSYTSDTVIGFLRQNKHIASYANFYRYFSLNPDFIKVKRADVINALKDEETFAQYFEEHYAKGLEIDVIEEVESIAFYGAIQQLEFVAKAIVKVANMQEGEYISCRFIGEVRQKLRNLLLRIVRLIDIRRISQFLINLFTLSKIHTLPFFYEVLVGVIKIVEQRTENSEENGHAIHMSAQVSSELNKAFCAEVYRHLEKGNIFHSSNWYKIVQFLETHDPKYLLSFIDEKLKFAENVLRFVEHYVTEDKKDNPVDFKYTISSPDKPIMADQFRKAISSALTDSTFFKLPQAVQIAAGVYYLGTEDNMYYYNIISQSAVDDLLFSWRKKYQPKSTSPQAETNEAAG
ncbi:MAG: KAP family NTPase [Oscillospiraceae bacterium]|jgi:predicted KAP-like P-loop ATPase|nr:KAP family NTPase [Oscillospiraceae bacterium]